VDVLVLVPQADAGAADSPRRQLSAQQLKALIEEAIIDAYDESEQRVGFLTML
jgi:hypothetical protein